MAATVTPSITGGGWERTGPGFGQFQPDFGSSLAHPPTKKKKVQPERISHRIRTKGRSRAHPADKKRKERKLSISWEGSRSDVGGESSAQGALKEKGIGDIVILEPLLNIKREKKKLREREIHTGRV